MFNDPLILVDAHGLTHMHNEIAEQKLLIKQLGDALIEAWPNSRPGDVTSGVKIRNAMFAYRVYRGDSHHVHALKVEAYNPWNDTIVIEGVTYAGAQFRKQEDDHNE